MKTMFDKTIYPLNDWWSWHAPPEMIECIVFLPNIHHPIRQPRTWKILSKGEDHRSHKCSKCGIFSHNCQTCSNPSSLPVNVKISNSIT